MLGKGLFDQNFLTGKKAGRPSAPDKTEEVLGLSTETLKLLTDTSTQVDVYRPGTFQQLERSLLTRKQGLL